MRKILPFSKITALQCCFAMLATGQTTINGGRVITGAWDASSASSSKPAKTGSVLPPACQIGEQYFKTDAVSGQNLFFCTATNTWSQMTGGSGGGGGGISVLTTRGDLAGYSNQSARIPVGTDGQELVADSSQANGLRYRSSSDSNSFANRPACTPALTGQTYLPTDGILGYRCTGSAWTAFGPISPVVPLRIDSTNANGIAGPGRTTLAGAAGATGSLTVSTCQGFPATVGMVLLDSEVIAGTCVNTTFMPIAGGRGYNGTAAASHSSGAAVKEQLFVWANNLNHASTQSTATVDVSGGYLSFTAPTTINALPTLVKPLPNGPGSPYSVSAGFMANFASNGDQGCGIGLRESSTNNTVILLFHATTFANLFNIGQYRSTDGVYTATEININASPLLLGGALYLKVQSDTTNRISSVSSDGLNFNSVISMPEPSFLSADQIFIACGSSAQFDTRASFFSWKEGN